MDSGISHTHTHIYVKSLPASYTCNGLTGSSFDPQVWCRTGYVYIESIAIVILFCTYHFYFVCLSAGERIVLFLVE